MVPTADDVATNRALAERVKRFLMGRPMYLRDPERLIEKIVSEVGADSRLELMQLEETVTRLVRNDEIMLGPFERDDECGFGRGSGPLVQRVIWVE